ncbi:MAG TPA: zinc-binding dehydrogenase [Polyangiaceae bacterium]|nr:zinc-binding dehydrogenase [Polyangiaceae bacterium]
MRAVVMLEHGGPEVLKLSEQPAPEPGEFDLLVEVHATSVNPVDAKVRRAGAGRKFPLILGYDVSGTVVACGARVVGFAPGDEVYGCPSLFGNGANAELVLLDARSAAKKPNSLDHATAACLPLVSLTAWEALHERARIEPGETILVHAGGGGVGHIAVQLARLHGCKVLTTAGRPESIAFCSEELGADEVIDYSSNDFVARVSELTHGKGLRCVFDTVGGEVFERSIECVAPCGQLVTILDSKPGARASALLYRSITVHYEFMGARVAYGEHPERQGAILAGIASLVDRGLLRPHVSDRFALESVADGHRQIETGHTLGKVAIAVR